MNWKLTALAAAVAMAGSGGALAAIDGGGDSGNGSLMANLKFTESPVVGDNNTRMATFDLGLDMNTFLSVASQAGTVITWDLDTGAFTNNKGLAAPTFDFGTAFDDLNGNTDFDLTKAQLAVYAFDGTGTGVGDKRVLTTGNFINATGTAHTQTATSGPTNNDMLGIPGSTTITNWIVAVNNKPTHTTAANGGSTADTGTAAFLTVDNLGKTSMFDTNGLYAGSYAAGTGILSGLPKALTMHLLQSSSVTGSHESAVTNLGFNLDGEGGIEFDNNGAATGGMNEYGLWTLQGSTLTYVTPVPEADSYALMLGGLGLVGLLARRRKAAQPLG